MLHPRNGHPANGGGCKKNFTEFLDNILFENCQYHPEVVCAMMGRIPFRIPAESYALQGVGRSYYFTDPVTTCVNFRREEGANIKFVIPKDDELPVVHRKA